MKRVVDFALAATGLLLVWPVLVLIAALIKAESSGPVFYCGVRVGRNGTPFPLIKFRTMVAAADKIGGSVTASNDPRITKTGAILRKYKLDELPQLINVVKGDMSLVGPRPVVESEMDHYSDEERNVVLSVLPGITDYCTLNFHDEEAILSAQDNPEKFYFDNILKEKIELQLKYVEEASLWTDIQILFATVLKLFSTRLARSS